MQFGHILRPDMCGLGNKLTEEFASKINLSPQAPTPLPIASADVRSKTVALLLLIYCISLHPKLEWFCGFVFGPCFVIQYSKTCVKRPLKKRQNKDLNDNLQLSEGQQYCRMLPLEHSALFLTCIKR